MPVRRQLVRSNSSSSNEERRDRDARRFGFLSGLKVCIINAKLEPRVVGELSDLAESKGAQLVGNPERADIVITEIGTRKRLERHISWKAAQRRAVLIPEWLTDSVNANKILEFGEGYWSVPFLKPRHPAPQFHAEPESVHVPSGSRHSPIELSDSETALDPALKSKYCIHRKSPLVCPNQDLVCQLAMLKRCREFQEDKQAHALAYQRCIATLKAYPRKIKTVEEIAPYPYIGPKMQLAISQYLSSGYIEEARRLWTDEFYNCMVLFTSIYGIGPATARYLYARGMRTLKDLEAYYEEESEVNDHRKARNQGILAALALYEDFSVKISREEVEAIANLIMQELEIILPGCIHTITGGYRRGKAESNDIDIVIAHPQHGKRKGTLQRLVDRLQRLGMITHLLPTASFRTPSSVKAYTEDEAVERALTVFLLPQDAPSFPHNPTGGARKHRRLDLLFAPIETYWCTVVGWTGSVMFERDLRQWCEDMKPISLKFDSSGLTRRHDSAQIVVNSEQHLFQILGLPFIEPHFRNCDY